MKKFISAVTAFAMAAGMMAGMVTVQAEDAAEIKTAGELQEAFNNGGNYRLAADISGIDANLTIGCTKDLSLDFDNNEIDLGNYYLNFTSNINNRNVTFSNGSIISTYASDCIHVNATPVLSLKHMDISGKSRVVYISAAANVTIDGCTIYNTPAYNNNNGVINASAGQISISDSTLRYNGTVDGYSAIRSTSGAPSFTLNNVTVIKEGTKGRSIAFTAGSATATINSGNYTGDLYVGSTGQKIIVQGGTFSFDPTAYVDTASYEVKTNADDSTYTVTAKQSLGPAEDPSLSVDETGYGEENIEEDGYKTKVFKVTASADGTNKKVRITAEGAVESPQEVELGTEITDGTVVFAVILAGTVDAEFPATIQAEFID